MFNKFNIFMKRDHLVVFYFFLGAISAIPFFVVPTSPFIYVNPIDHIDFISNIHPNYTHSLGLAFPFPLVGISVAYMSLVLLDKVKLKSDVLIMLLFLFLLSYLLIVTSSLKSASFSASIFSAYFAIRLSDSFHGVQFLKGFVLGLLAFCILHACSILYDGPIFSQRIEGISFFGIEIYQALISYSPTTALLFGIVLLYPCIVDQSLPHRNEIGKNIFKIVFFISIFIIHLNTSRRSAFLVMACVIIVYLWIKFIKTPDRKYSFLMILTGLLFGILALNNYVFTGVKSLDWVNMIQPRLNIYVRAVHLLSNSDISQILTGSEGGWATYHNSFLDILVHAGVLGLALIGLCIFFLFSLYKKNYVGKISGDNRKNICIYFIICAVLFDNIVNTAFSTPYYSVSAAIFLTLVLRTESSISKSGAS